MWCGTQWEAAWPCRPKPVLLAEVGVGRARNLTDDNLEELEGCVDLGFGFSYDEIPEFCSTLPALELCYSMSQLFLDEHHHQQPQPQTPPEVAAPPSASPPIANRKISSPAPEKRLRFRATVDA